MAVDGIAAQWVVGPAPPRTAQASVAPLNADEAVVAGAAQTTEALSAEALPAAAPSFDALLQAQPAALADTVVPSSIQANCTPTKPGAVLQLAPRLSTEDATLSAALPADADLSDLASQAVAAEAPQAAEPASTPDTTTLPERFLQWLDTIRQACPPSPQPSPPSSATSDAPVAAPATPLTAKPSSSPRTDSQVATEAVAVGTTAVATVAAPTQPLPERPAQSAAVLPTFALGAVQSALASNPINAPPVTTSPAPPLAMDAPDWPQRLGEQIHWRVGEGIQEARIEITPRDLGVIDVRLLMDDGKLRVHLSAAHTQTRELLQSELPRLKEFLQQGGVQLADAQVGRDAPGRESRSGQPPAPFTHGRPAPEEQHAPLQILWQQRRGLLDDYA